MALFPLGPAMAGLSASFDPQRSHATPAVKTLVRLPQKINGISCLFESLNELNLPREKIAHL
jgi:hypothetical protein